MIGLTCVAVAALFSVGSPAASAGCPNETFRSGPSADLPDCRAYELVTPPKNSRTFFAGTEYGAAPLKFSSSPVSPSGDGYLWSLFSSGVEGSPSTGSANLFEAQRTAAGWVHKYLSPTPAQAEISSPGSADPTHQYITFEVEDFRGGSLTGCGCSGPAWVRYPDGSFHPLGEGTLPTDPDTDGYQNGLIDDLTAEAWWIAAGGSHRIFEADVPLTIEAPSGRQVYDRTPSGLKLVSLLPGEAPPATESRFAGAAADGSSVLFRSEENLYLRIDNADTALVASGAGGSITPGGVNADGSRAFFVQEGDISYYDVEAEEVKGVVTTTGGTSLAYVSPDGSHVYFLSEEELISGEGTPGDPNLYLWDGSSIHFIATVTDEDLVSSGSGAAMGLKFWAEVEPNPVAKNRNFLLDTARTTFDGKVIVFESRAKLTDYPNEGHVEVYRYETDAEEMTCVSCSPTEPTAGADSRLVFLNTENALAGLNASQEIPSLSADGERVVFESKDALLPADVNGVRDVYEWNAGTLSLISTGHASQPSGVIGVSSSGNDIFFQTTEQLVPQGQNSGTFAIYDARVDGGLASQQAASPLLCDGEGCLGLPSPPPGLAAPGSAQIQGKGNVKPRCRHVHRRRKGNKAKHRHGKRKACRAKRRGGRK